MQYSSKKIKKLILKALPYAIFAYAGNKIGYAYRISEGKDISEKLLPFFNNIGTSFARVFPSFHPIDILVGIVILVILVLSYFQMNQIPRFAFLHQLVHQSQKPQEIQTGRGIRLCQMGRGKGY